MTESQFRDELEIALGVTAGTILGLCVAMLDEDGRVDVDAWADIRMIAREWPWHPRIQRDSAIERNLHSLLAGCRTPCLRNADPALFIESIRQIENRKLFG